MGLAERDRLVVRLRHGFDGTKEKLVDVAKRLELSLAAVSQIEKKALETVRLAVMQASRGGVTVDNLTVEDLQISNRTRRVLAGARVHTVFDLCAKPKSFFAALPGFGEGCLSNLEEALAKYGLSLRQPTGD